MRLFRRAEHGHYSFVLPFTERTGREVSVGDGHEVPFEGKGLNVGMVKRCDRSEDAAVILHAGLENPTWDDLGDLSERVNRAWRAAYGDTTHVSFEGASVYGDTIWLWFGS